MDAATVPGLAGVKMRRATADDAAAIASIYAPYVRASVVSFETEAPDEAEMRGRIEALGDLYPWLVACDEDGAVLGYAYGCAFRTRPAYRFTVETTVYVADGAHRRGIGTLLYRALLAVAGGAGLHPGDRRDHHPRTRRASAFTNRSASRARARTRRSASSSANGAASASGSARWRRWPHGRKSRGRSRRCGSLSANKRAATSRARSRRRAGRSRRGRRRCRPRRPARSGNRGRRRERRRVPRR